MALMASLVLVHTVLDATCIAVRPDGKVFAVGGWDTPVRIHRLSDGWLIREHRATSGHATGIAYSPDGSKMAVSEGDGRIHVWSATSASLLKSFRSGTSYVSGIAWSPDGSFFATSGYDNKVSIWDGKTFALRRRLVGLQSDAYCVAVSPSGVLGGGPDGTVRLWDGRSGKLLRTWKVRGDVSAIAAGSDGRLVLATTLGGSVYAFDIENGETLFERHESAGGHDALALNPLGTSFAVGSRNASVALWDLATRQPYNDMRGSLNNDVVDAVTAAAFTPGGTRLLTGSAGGPVLEWDVEQRLLTRRIGS
jgi:WD40 repeat protein